MRDYAADNRMIRYIAERAAQLYARYGVEVKPEFIMFELRFVRSKASPLRGVRHSPHQLISGRVQPVPQSLMRVARAGLQGGMGPFSSAASFSPVQCRSHIQPWIS